MYFYCSNLGNEAIMIYWKFPMKKLLLLSSLVAVVTLTACSDIKNDSSTSNKKATPDKKYAQAGLVEARSRAGMRGPKGGKGRPGNRGRKEGRGRPGRMPGQREQLALAEYFIGIHTAVGIEKGLYKIKATGISTAIIVNAAKDFLASLNAEQKARTKYAIDALEWQKWSNVDNGIYARQGVKLKEMSASQKAKALGLMQASLSAKGLEQARNIMKTDQTLKELNNNANRFGEELYFFTIMGEPSETQPWGWQVDGHHLVVNFFVLGDQVVFSPVFMGAEPVFTTSGKHKGNILFQEEQELGMTLMQSLSAGQQQQAIIGSKGREDMRAVRSADNLTLDYAGIRASELGTKQQQQLLNLIAEYIGNMPDNHAKIKLSEVRTHLDNTWFAWRGDISVDAVFYYRVHSPVILIEFDHQGPVFTRNLNGSRAATRNHIHTMLRTPNGNDYGKDLLHQHLTTHHAPQKSE